MQMTAIWILLNFELIFIFMFLYIFYCVADEESVAGGVVEGVLVSGGVAGSGGVTAGVDDVEEVSGVVELD